MIQDANSENGGTTKNAYTITEMSITGNMKLSDMQARKIKWRTVDDEKTQYTKSKIDHSTNWDKVELGPQVIRTFKVEFNKSKNSPKNLDSFVILL